MDHTPGRILYRSNKLQSVASPRQAVLDHRHVITGTALHSLLLLSKAFSVDDVLYNFADSGRSA
jgi:hypothetical protein